MGHQGEASIAATSPRPLDGISEYKLDNRGFIYQHTITDLDWDVAQMRDRIAALSNILAHSRASRSSEADSGSRTSCPRVGSESDDIAVYY